MADYLDNNEFQKELEQSHKDDKLTRGAIKGFQALIDHISWGLPYKDQELKKDVKSHAMLICLTKWKKYNLEDNTSFSYFTSVVLNGLRAGYKKYSPTHNKKGIILISMDALLNSQNTAD